MNLATILIIILIIILLGGSFPLYHAHPIAGYGSGGVGTLLLILLILYLCGVI